MNSILDQGKNLGQTLENQNKNKNQSNDSEWSLNQASDVEYLKDESNDLKNVQNIDIKEENKTPDQTKENTKRNTEKDSKINNNFLLDAISVVEDLINHYGDKRYTSAIISKMKDSRIVFLVLKMASLDSKIAESVIAAIGSNKNIMSSVKNAVNHKGFSKIFSHSNFSNLAHLGIDFLSRTKTSNASNLISIKNLKNNQITNSFLNLQNNKSNDIKILLQNLRDKKKENVEIVKKILTKPMLLNIVKEVIKEPDVLNVVKKEDLNVVKTEEIISPSSQVLKENEALNKGYYLDPQTLKKIERKITIDGIEYTQNMLLDLIKKMSINDINSVLIKADISAELAQEAKNQKFINDDRNAIEQSVQEQKKIVIQKEQEEKEKTIINKINVIDKKDLITEDVRNLSKAVFGSNLRNDEFLQSELDDVDDEDVESEVDEAVVDEGDSLSDKLNSIFSEETDVEKEEFESISQKSNSALDEESTKDVFDESEIDESEIDEGFAWQKTIYNEPEVDESEIDEDDIDEGIAQKKTIPNKPEIDDDDIDLDDIDERIPQKKHFEVNPCIKNYLSEARECGAMISLSNKNLSNVVNQPTITKTMTEKEKYEHTR